MQHIKQSTVNYIYVHNTDVDDKYIKGKEKRYKVHGA